MYCKFPNFNLYNDHRITIMKTEVLKFKVQHKRNTRELQEKYLRYVEVVLKVILAPSVSSGQVPSVAHSGLSYTPSLTHCIYTCRVGLKGTAGDRRGLQGTAGDCRGLQGTAGDRRGLQGTARDCKGLQGTAGDCRGLLGTAGDCT